MNLRQILCNSIAKLENAGIKNADLDAQVLLCHALKINKAFLLSHPEIVPTRVQKIKINKLINRRSKNEPIAYITGHKEFYNYDFQVNKDVLIPRPESEFLIEQALNRIKNPELRIKDKTETVRTMIHDSKFRILDIGTGSGCLIITLVQEIQKQYSNKTIQQFSFFASDISRKALLVAKKNAKVHGVENDINFVQSDLFRNQKLDQKFNLIIANLPYVPKELLHISSIDDICNKNCLTKDLFFEPTSAIFAKKNGTEIINKFIDQVENYLSPNGEVLIELDPRNAIEIRQHAKMTFPKAKIELSKDLAGMDRYLKIRLLQ